MLQTTFSATFVVSVEGTSGTKRRRAAGRLADRSGSDHPRPAIHSRSSGKSVSLATPAGHLETVADMVGLAGRNDGRDEGRLRISDRRHLLGHLFDRPSLTVDPLRLGDEGSRDTAGD